MKTITWITPLLSAALVAVCSGGANGVTGDQYGEIRTLGQLNGIALHCGYLDQTRRMKQALVDNLPKRRELGLAFDQVTNTSYLEFIETGGNCPDVKSFSRRVNQAIRRLEEAF